MKTLSNAYTRLLPVLLVFPAIAHAHPGHDGDHGLSWDMVGEVVHRLSSPYHLFPVFAAAVATLLVLRAIRAGRGKQDRDARE